MEMPQQVYDTFLAVQEKFPELRRGDDEQRREGMRRGIATVNARVKGEGALDGARWVHKTEHSNLSSHSKDALGFVPHDQGPLRHGEKQRMHLWDMVEGASRNVFPRGDSHEFREAFVIAVAPHDWLAAAGGQQPGGGEEPDRKDPGGSGAVEAIAPLLLRTIELLEEIRAGQQSQTQALTAATQDLRDQVRQGVRVRF